MFWNPIKSAWRAWDCRNVSIVSDRDKSDIFQNSASLETNDNHFIRPETCVGDEQKHCVIFQVTTIITIWHNDDVQKTGCKEEKTDELLLLKQIFYIYFKCFLC